MSDQKQGNQSIPSQDPDYKNSQPGTRQTNTGVGGSEPVDNLKPLQGAGFGDHGGTGPGIAMFDKKFKDEEALAKDKL
jgi:hypothetical protein